MLQSKQGNNTHPQSEMTPTMLFALQSTISCNSQSGEDKCTVQNGALQHVLLCRGPSDAEASMDLPTRLTLQRYRNEASAAKYEMGAVVKELKRHKREHERVRQQQQVSMRGLKEQVSLGQQAIQQQVFLFNRCCLLAKYK